MKMAFSWFRELSGTKKALVVLGAGSIIGGSIFLLGRSGILSIFRHRVSVQDLPEKRILVLGLNGAGKTSLLQCLNTAEGTGGSCEPTEGFNVMCLQNEGIALNIWEVGGSESVRSYWDNFLQGTEVLVYIVDAVDDDRFDEAKSELHKLLQDPKLTGVPIVLVANKQDLPGAKNGLEVQEAMGLIAPDREVHVIETQTSSGSVSILAVKQIKTYMRTLTYK